jgi:adenosylcobyric acid synthase
VSGNCLGTYIHGILDNQQFIDWMIKDKLEETQCLASENPKPDTTLESYKSFKDEQYNRLADHVRKYVDVERIMKVMRL